MASGLFDNSYDVTHCVKGAAFGFVTTLELDDSYGVLSWQAGLHIICGRAMTNYMQAELKSALCWPRLDQCRQFPGFHCLWSRSW